MCPVAQASATACVSMIAPRALFTMITPFFILAILSLSNMPLVKGSERPVNENQADGSSANNDAACALDFSVGLLT
jgi:hypothetical protein